MPRSPLPPIPQLLLQVERRSSLFLQLPMTPALGEALLSHLEEARRTRCSYTAPERSRSLAFVRGPGPAAHPLVQRLPVHPEDVPKGEVVRGWKHLRRVYHARGTVSWQAEAADGGELRTEGIPSSEILSAMLFRAPPGEVPSLFARLVEASPPLALRVAREGLRYIGLPRRLEAARDLMPYLSTAELAPLFASDDAEVRTQAIRSLSSLTSLRKR